MDQQVYRVKVLRTFLKAGIPINKLGCFREILEETALRLTDRSHLMNLLPFVVDEEHTRLKSALSDQNVSLIFDGTTRIGEALAILLRHVTTDFTIKQYLVRLQMLVKSMNGEELACELNSCLSVSYGIKPESLLASMHDRASTNDVAMRTVKIVYPSVVDIGCFSHTIDLAGHRFNTTVLSSFMSLWVSLFSHSPKAKFLWKEKTGMAGPSYSATRWWSQWKMMKQLMASFGDVPSFINSLEGSQATKSKLLHFLNDEKSRSVLEVELAIVVDAGEPLVKAIYKLEGDGPLLFDCYEIVSTVLSAFQMDHYPNTDAVIAKHANGNKQVKHQWKGYALSCINPVLEYLTNTITVKLQSPLAVFKVARFFNPKKVREICLSASDLDSLSSISFCDHHLINHLKDELPLYLAKAEEIDTNYCPLKWWKANSEELPRWSETSRKVLLIQPSSAAAERIFSLLNNSFNDSQLSSLKDYVEASLMLQYNSK